MKNEKPCEVCDDRYPGCEDICGFYELYKAREEYRKREDRKMTRYGRYAHCDQCGETVYEGDYIKSYGGQNYCEECWREFLKAELFGSYIPDHMTELLEAVQEELENLG